MREETKTVAWETTTNVALDPSYAVCRSSETKPSLLRTYEQSGLERTFTLVITGNEGHLDSSRFFLQFYHPAITRTRVVPSVSTGS